MTFFESLVEGARQAYCTLSTPAPFFLSTAANIYRLFPEEGQADDLEASAQLFRNARNLACNQAPDSVADEFDPPFSGGQCMGAPYLASGELLRNGVVATTFNNRFGIGPISLQRTAPSSTTTQALALVDSEGRILASLGGGPPDDMLSINVTNLQRTDGLPDNCGDPPADILPYSPLQNTTDVDVTFDDDQGNPVTITPNLTFGPVELLPDSALSIPITVVFEPGSSLFGDFNLTTGDICFSIGNGAGDGVPTTPIEIPEDENPEENQLVVIGARVVTNSISDASRATEIFQSGPNPNIYAPRLGSVAFLYETSTGARSWGVDIPVKNTDFVVWSPQPAINVGGTPEPGVDFSVFPIIQTVDCTCGNRPGDMTA